MISVRSHKYLLAEFTILPWVIVSAFIDDDAFIDALIDFLCNYFYALGLFFIGL